MFYGPRDPYTLPPPTHLPQPVCAVHSLQVLHRVPVVLQEDHRVGTGQVEAQAAHLQEGRVDASRVRTREGRARREVVHADMAVGFKPRPPIITTVSGNNTQHTLCNTLQQCTHKPTGPSTHRGGEQQHVALHQVQHALHLSALGG